MCIASETTMQLEVQFSRDTGPQQGQDVYAGGANCSLRSCWGHGHGCLAPSYRVGAGQTADMYRHPFATCDNRLRLQVATAQIDRVLTDLQHRPAATAGRPGRLLLRRRNRSPGQMKQRFPDMVQIRLDGFCPAACSGASLPPRWCAARPDTGLDQLEHIRLSSSPCKHTLSKYFAGLQIRTAGTGVDVHAWYAPSAPRYSAWMPASRI